MQLDDPAARMRLGGLVLAGGQSRRMGRAKAWLPVEGVPMLRRVLDAVREGLTPASAGPPLLVVVAAPGQDLPPLPEDVRVVRDDVPGEGPLRGLWCGLRSLESSCDAVFVSSCDAPRLSPGFVRYVVGRLGDSAVAVPVAGGRHHPLAAAYRPASMVKQAAALLAAGRRRPFDLFGEVATCEIGEEDLRRIDPELRSLHNINTPADYDAVSGT